MDYVVEQRINQSIEIICSFAISTVVTLKYVRLRIDTMSQMIEAKFSSVYPTNTSIQRRRFTFL